MKRLDYALMDPTGNVTLLVETPVPPASQPLAAARLMEAEPAAEQVGFLSRDPSGLCLRMAGGEFCGNAAMSAAALAAMDAGLQAGTVSVRVSGAAEPVEVTVAPLSRDGRRGTVAMPRPLGIEQVSFSGEEPLPVVRFRGISHVILERTPDRAAAEALAPLWCRQLGADALGLLFLDRSAGTPSPLVWVPAAGTLCWENSCASGTTAAAVYLARETGGGASVSLRQPGGTLTAAVSQTGEPSLSGTVRLVKRDSLTVDL